MKADYRILSEVVTLVERRLQRTFCEEGQARPELHLTYKYNRNDGQWVWEAEVMVSLAKGLPAATVSVHRFNYFRGVLELISEDPRLDSRWAKEDL